MHYEYFKRDVSHQRDRPLAGCPLAHHHRYYADNARNIGIADT
jgi:hypothetical protein